MDLTKVGLSLVLDLITEAEEAELIRNFDTKKRPEPGKKGGRNSIQRYGSSLPYNSNLVSGIIPAYFDFVLDRLVERQLVKKRPISVTINEYLKGQIIKPHVDSKASGTVISVLSLQNEATMILTKNKENHPILLPPRSLVQLRNDVRYNWLHSIEPLKADIRYSIVFRCAE